MKTIYTFLFSFLFIYSTTTAQINEKAIQPYFFTTGHQQIELADGQRLVSGKTGDWKTWLQPTLFVALFDTAGNEIWWRYLFDGEIERGIHHKMFVVDNRVYVFLNGGLCDVCCVGKLEVIDLSNGQVMEENYHIDDDFFDHIGYIHGVEEVEGGFIIQTTSSVIRSNYELEKIWEIEETPSIYVNDQPSNSLAITTDNTVLLGISHETLFTIDTSGIILQQQRHTAASLIGVTTFNNKWLVQTIDDLWLVNANLEVEKTVNLVDTIDLLKVIDNQAIVLTQSTSGTIQLSAFDTDLNLINTQESDRFKRIKINDFEFNGEDQLNVLGTEYYESSLGVNEEQAKNSALVLVDVQLPIVDTSEIDIGVTEVNTIEQPTVIATPESICSFFNGGGGYGIINHSDIKIRVDNFSNEVINDFYLNLEYPICSYICSDRQVFSQRITNANIPPEGSKVFTWSDLSISNQLTEGIHDLCIWTSVPNNKTDRNHSNNRACKSFIVTSTEDFNSSSTEVDIFPNPINNEQFLHLETNFSIQNLQILNAIGQIVKIGLSEEIMNKLISVRDLESGVYYITGKMEQGVFVKKVTIMSP